MPTPRSIAILAIGLAALGAFLAAFVSVLDLDPSSTPLASPQPTATPIPSEVTLEDEMARGERSRSQFRGTLPILAPSVTSSLSPEGLVASTPDLPTDRPVLQIWRGFGGYAVSTRPRVEIPTVTLWADGRAVFPDSEGVVREAQLDPPTMAELVDIARVLYELEDFYPEAGGIVTTHALIDYFSVETARGHKTVRVRGDIHDREAHLAGKRPSIVQQLRAIEEAVQQVIAVDEAVQASLPRDAPMMLPDEVIVVTGPRPDLVTIRQWPADLVGHVEGDRARAAVRLGGVGRIGVFLLEGQTHEVALMPVLPILISMWPWWPEGGGVPRHPGIVRYNTGHRPYRFSEGDSQAEIVAWYRSAMADLGWSLVNEQGNKRQIWVREDDLVFYLYFATDHMRIEFQRLEGGIPRHPLGEWGGCEGGNQCQLVRDVSEEEARAWFREHMGYFGWSEVGPGLYRSRTDEVSLEFRVTAEGIAVTEVDRFSGQTEPDGGISTYLVGRLELDPDLVLVSVRDGRVYRLEPGCERIGGMLHANIGSEAGLLVLKDAAAFAGPLKVMTVNVGSGGGASCVRDDGVPYPPAPSPALPGPTPTPGSAPPPPDRPPMSYEEEKQAREEADRELRARGVVHITVVGPETAGSRIHIAGKDVQLPPDAYVSELIVKGLCARAPCPEYPTYEISRGNSTIVVSIPSGTIIKETVAPGEEGAFDFLKEALASSD